VCSVECYSLRMEHSRRAMTPAEEERVRFWVDALVHGNHRSTAAKQLHAIGVRTRGAVRTRGSVRAPAPSRFPAGTPVTTILGILQNETSPELRSNVASALAEFGGAEALAVLESLVVGDSKDPEPGVRASAIDAVGLIGGPDAVHVLERVSATDNDPTVRHIAHSIIESLR